MQIEPRDFSDKSKSLLEHVMKITTGYFKSTTIKPLHLMSSVWLNKEIESTIKYADIISDHDYDRIQDELTNVVPGSSQKRTGIPSVGRDTNEIFLKAKELILLANVNKIEPMHILFGLCAADTPARKLLEEYNITPTKIMRILPEEVTVDDNDPDFHTI